MLLTIEFSLGSCFKTYSQTNIKTPITYRPQLAPELTRVEQTDVFSQSKLIYVRLSSLK